MEDWKKPEIAQDAPPPAEPGAEAAGEDDFVAGDYEDFTQRFPDTDLRELEENGMFLRFCGSRYGRESLADLYEDFLEITRAVWEAAVQSTEDKRSRSTGTGGAGGGDSSYVAAGQICDHVAGRAAGAGPHQYHACR